MVQCNYCHNWFHDDYVTVSVLFRKEIILVGYEKPVLTDHSIVFCKK